MRDWLKATAIIIITTFAACAKRLPSPASAPPPLQAEDVALYQRGLAAFRESTPEGYARAADLFHRAVIIAPNQCDYALNFAQANLFLALEQEQNLEDFKQALESGAIPLCGANTPFGLRLEALSALPEFQLGKDRAAAAALIERALQAEPENPLSWYVSWKLSPTQQPAQKLYEGIKASELVPNLALTHYELGNFWLIRNRMAEARRAFEHAIEANPRHFRSYIGLAQSISEMDEEQDVEPLYRRAVELAPAFLQGRIVLGDYLAWSGQNDLATEQYLAALQHDARYEPAYLGLAANYIEIEKLKDAENACWQAIGINPRSYKAYNFLGNIWYSRHDFDKAQQAFEESLRLVPSFSDALYGLATVLWEKDQINGALAQFDRLLDYNPLHAAGYLSRSTIRVDRHQFKEALQDSAQALKLYNAELQRISVSIEKANKRGLTGRAQLERRKKDRIESAMKSAREVNAEAEARSGK